MTLAGIIAVVVVLFAFAFWVYWKFVRKGGGGSGPNQPPRPTEPFSKLLFPCTYDWQSPKFSDNVKAVCRIADTLKKPRWRFGVTMEMIGDAVGPSSAERPWLEDQKRKWAAVHSKISECVRGGLNIQLYGMNTNIGNTGYRRSQDSEDKTGQKLAALWESELKRLSGIVGLIFCPANEADSTGLDIASTLVKRASSILPNRQLLSWGDQAWAAWTDVHPQRLVAVGQGSSWKCTTSDSGIIHELYSGSGWRGNPKPLLGPCKDFVRKEGGKGTCAFYHIGLSGSSIADNYDAWLEVAKEWCAKAGV